MTVRGGSLVRKWMTSVRQEGLACACRRAAGRARETVFTTNAADWYCAELRELPAVHRPAGAADAEVDFDAADDVRTWLQAIRSEFGWVWVEEELEAARTHGHLFPLLCVEGREAGYIKVGLGRAYVTDFRRTIEIPPRTAFIYDTFVHPSCRRRGLGAFAVAKTLEFLQRRGTSLVWCHIPRWNRASIRAYTRCGFRKVRFVRYLRLLGCELYTHNPERLLRQAEQACTAQGERGADERTVGTPGITTNGIGKSG